VKSFLTKDFLDCFKQLPTEVQELARRNYRLWQANSAYPSLRFKPVQGLPKIFSVRVGRDWRALGERQGDTMTWFWIGSHSEYDQMLG